MTASSPSPVWEKLLKAGKLSPKVTGSDWKWRINRTWKPGGPGSNDTCLVVGFPSPGCAVSGASLRFPDEHIVPKTCGQAKPSEVTVPKEGQRTWWRNRPGLNLTGKWEESRWAEGRTRVFLWGPGYPLALTESVINQNFSLLIWPDIAVFFSTLYDK